MATWNHRLDALDFFFSRGAYINKWLLCVPVGFLGGVLVVTIFFFFWEVGPGALHSISRLYEFELGACRAVTAQSGAGAGAAAGPRASLRRGGCPVLDVYSSLPVVGLFRQILNHYSTRCTAVESSRLFWLGDTLSCVFSHSLSWSPGASACDYTNATRDRFYRSFFLLIIILHSPSKRLVRQFKQRQHILSRSAIQIKVLVER